MKFYSIGDSICGRYPFSIKVIIPNNAPQEWNLSDDNLESSPVPVIAE
jgi:hypothetical protein